MDNLRQSTRCASDEFDQHFGIAGAFNRPWAVKQGWSGDSYPEGTCGPTTRPALHSTGTVGAGDRSIGAVYTLHPVGTSYGKAFTDTGRLTRSLEPRIGNSVLTRLPAGVEVLVGCQKKGQSVSVPRTPTTGGRICPSTADTSPTSTSAIRTIDCRMSPCAEVRSSSRS